MSLTNLLPTTDSPALANGLERHYMVLHTDGEGLITYANQNFLTVSGWTPKRIIGKSIWQMFADLPEHQTNVNRIWDRLLLGKSWFGKIEKLSRTGEPYFVNLLAIPTLLPDGTLDSTVFLELDITEDIRLQEQLGQIAFIDFETGLMSRHKLELTVNEYIAKGQHFSFVYLTIDHYFTLKELQSQHTEQQLIQEFTNRLKRYFQDNPIARVGASNFVVLTPFGDWYIQGFYEFLEQQPIYINRNVQPISVSGGIVRYPEDQQTYTQLWKVALKAAEEVMHQGGGRIVSLSAESHKVLNRRAEIDRKLIAALDLRHLHVAYQPQFDVASGKVNGYEALVRWEDDELGTITPDELIPIAEENGLIKDIGAFVVEEAAKLAAQWHQSGSDLKISVNSSIREFTNSPMKERILSILKETGCPPNKLQLEITEKFALKAEEENSIICQMQELQTHGIEFTLDDFGTGYASLRYMQHLPIATAKIDRVFTDSLLSNPKTQRLVEGLVQFCKSMGLYVVAEGVTNEEQFQLLKAMGVDGIEGYYIGEPVPAEQIQLEPSM